MAGGTDNSTKPADYPPLPPGFRYAKPQQKEGIAGQVSKKPHPKIVHLVADGQPDALSLLGIMGPLLTSVLGEYGALRTSNLAGSVVSAIPSDAAMTLTIMVDQATRGLLFAS
ncbi:MAG: hypothetical protein AAGF15_10100, partial [Pseudomonadota bacterium]